jgi:hypothetical protein
MVGCGRRWGRGRWRRTGASHHRWVGLVPALRVLGWAASSDGHFVWILRRNVIFAGHRCRSAPRSAQATTPLPRSDAHLRPWVAQRARKSSHCNRTACSE